MPSQLLTLLKYLFLAVLYLFFLRVLRAVWAELRQPKVVQPADADVDLPASRALEPTIAAVGSPASGRGDGPWASASGPTASVVVLEPPSHRNERYEISSELTIGRSGQCTLSVDDDSFVSQYHARLFRQGGDVWVEDLGSTNGTLVNRRPINQPVTLRRGDQVQVGKTVLEVAS